VRFKLLKQNMASVILDGLCLAGADVSETDFSQALLNGITLEEHIRLLLLPTQNETIKQRKKVELLVVFRDFKGTPLITNHNNTQALAFLKSKG
jgi:uncharacterized protein YjbI with pentapeptide repeats